MDNLLNILLLISSTIIYYTTKKPVINNYKLRKDFKLKGVNTSVLPTEVLRKVNDIDETRFLEHEFGPAIIEFINVIKQNISHSDLSLFYNNFNNIETSVKKFKILNFIFNETIAAQWVPDKNIIELSPDNYESTIYHELLHAASTYIDPKTNIVFCGFQQIKDIKNQIGEGLNEGYTQYLTEKLFSHAPLLKAYPYEKRIAEAVEMIVGEKEMQSLFFNANLKGLIDILKQYNTEENIHDFITTLDFLNKHLTDKKLTPNSEQIRLNSLKSINSFLIQTYTKKILLENSTDKNNLKETFDKLLPFLIKIPTEAKINGKTSTITDNNSMFEIIKNAITDHEQSKNKKANSK